MLDDIFSTGPWLTNPRTDAVTMGFTTCLPCSAAIDYRLHNTKQWTRVWQCSGGQIITDETRHIFHLTNLLPGQIYDYRAVATDFKEEAARQATFKTFSENAETCTFMVLADLQFSPEKRRCLIRKYHELCNGENCDFVVSLGDMCGAITDFDKDILQDHVQLFCDLGASSRPVIFLRGNHELRGTQSPHWADFFGTQSGDTYSAFRLGPAAFLALDSWADQPASPNPDSVFRGNLDKDFLDRESRFVDNALLQPWMASAPFKIVLAHGASHSHIDQFSFLGVNMRNMTDRHFRGFPPPFPLSLWICGHIHHYIRTVPGTKSCISISKPPQPVVTGEDYSFPVITTDGPDVMAEIVPPSGIQSSAFAVTVTQQSISVRAISEEKGIIDSFTIFPDGTIHNTGTAITYTWK